MNKSKKSLILLSGTLCNEKLWENQIQTLSKEYNVMVADLSKDNSIESMAKRILKDAPEKFSLAGLSLGGIVALEIMKQSQDRVEKLVLLDTNPYPPTKEQIKTWNYFKQLSQNGEFEKVTKEYLLPNLMAPENSVDINQEIVIQMSNDVGETGMHNQLTALENRNDNTNILNHITVPTLIIVGEKDVVCPIEMSEYMSSEIPNSDIKVIKGAGHLTSLEKPQVVTDVINNFL